MEDSVGKATTEDSRAQASLRKWDQVYRQSRHLSIWPWSHMVSLVHRHVMDFGPGLRVLELGCGAGANISFFLKNECEYWAIEGSRHVVDMLRREYPSNANQIIHGDFAKRMDFPVTFDIVLDRGSITHNETARVRETMEHVRHYLKSGGYFIGTDWFSTDSDEFQKVKSASDRLVFDNYNDGPFAGVGVTHFFRREHVEAMCLDLEIEGLYLRKTERLFPEPAHRHAAWDIVARKS